MKYPLVKKPNAACNDPNHTFFSPILFPVQWSKLCDRSVCVCACGNVAFLGHIRSIAITFEIILIFVALMGRHLVSIKWKDDEKYVSADLRSSLPAAPLFRFTLAYSASIGTSFFGESQLTTKYLRSVFIITQFVCAINPFAVICQYTGKNLLQKYSWCSPVHQPLCDILYLVRRVPRDIVYDEETLTLQFEWIKWWAAQAQSTVLPSGQIVKSGNRWKLRERERKNRNLFPFKWFAHSGEQ